MNTQFLFQYVTNLNQDHNIQTKCNRCVPQTGVSPSLYALFSLVLISEHMVLKIGVRYDNKLHTGIQSDLRITYSQI